MSPASAAVRPLLLPLVPLALAVHLAAAADPAAACTGSKPPQPACGKTLAIAKSVPGVVLNAGATSFTVPTLVYFQMNDFPPGSGICPPGPHFVTLSLTATCTSPPHGSGSVTAQIAQGFNTVTVPVTVGAGPQRRCSVSGTATLPLGDGTTLTAAGDQNVCLVDPAPGNPAVPRLDMQSLEPSIARVHAGDQVGFTYRIANNDPLESFAGELEVQMVNTSRLPGASGPTPPGTGVYSVSDPGLGDNFPLAFTADLVDGCVQLPQDPGDPAIPTLTRTVSLDPGESIEVEVFSRPWGMCASGSCGEGTLVLEGIFSDATDGLACAGMAVAVDTATAPAYGWADAGEAGRAVPGLRPGAVAFEGEPVPGQLRMIELLTTQAQLAVDGVASPAPPQVLAGAVGADRSRIMLAFEPPGGYDAAALQRLQIFIEWAEATNELLEAFIRFFGRIDGAPAGFENTAPVGHGVVEIVDVFDGAVDSYFELTYQVHVVGIDEIGDYRDVTFDGIRMRSFPGGFEVFLENGVVAPGKSPVLQRIEVNQDFRGFFSRSPQALGQVFTDGFESGDLARWSSTTP